ncbi:efflux RND transporter periplasmic adaptor subunit [Thalassotalea sp. M1531]|uniref:Efflux RND transporter periplasmic adaptor subunit n=1 Tax=Thalassotalea algicola TaxID=2716224 RepID=A0A7Y0LEN8_9GAMM|nr:efflux RND transporter periplasmic adaptor subunit [Thalassotalea algicola]NMP32296.1 efflux RND transporter periplasmic adaptor subunit [Thalassotalea algicola]
MINKKKLLPFAVLAVLLLLAYIVASNPPQTKRGRPSAAPQLNVEVLTIKKQNIALKIDSYGIVKPRTQSVLLPQVSGEINYISPSFRDGGFFEKGELLVKLDDRDYTAEINIAKASLFSAQQALSEEKARVEQAKQDWERLGNTNQPSELVLRKPQLLAAEAKVFSAEASLAKAELALERTEIKAPYTGRILLKEVDIGQVVSQNTKLADIYAVDYVEVRLPIKNNDLSFMQLPEATRFSAESKQHQPSVTIFSELVNQQQWQGKVVRTEGAFDQNSQQLFVVAQIDDPYGVEAANGLPLKIGQYVSAKINGKVIDNAIKVPNKAIYQGSYVFIIKDGLLMRKEIAIDWQNSEFAMVAKGLDEEDLLVITSLGQVNSGTPVSISIKDGIALNNSARKHKVDEQTKGHKGKTRNSQHKESKTKQGAQS